MIQLLKSLKKWIIELDVKTQFHEEKGKQYFKEFNLVKDRLSQK